MKQIILAAFLFLNYAVFAQNPQYYEVKKHVKHLVLTPDENGNIDIYRISGLFESAKKITYIDSANDFKITVPKWVYIRETNDKDFFGGTLPAINEIENAIVISSARKSKYNSFKDFKKFIIEDSGYVKGAKPKWANDRTFISIDPDSLPKDNYSAYKVVVNRNGNIFVSKFVLAESKTAYLFLQFTATTDTYPINVNKFHEFLSKLKINL